MKLVLRHACCHVFNKHLTLFGGGGGGLPLSKTCLFCISEHFYSRNVP
jgi:hypothetical protein